MAPLIVYVDVDDTLVRSVGSKVIPISAVIEHVRSLKQDGAVLYCWSSGGAVYAEEIALRLNLKDCFTGFLPKPHVLLDDQAVSDWRRLLQIHPTQCGTNTAAAYAERVGIEENG